MRFTIMLRCLFITVLLLQATRLFAQPEKCTITAMVDVRVERCECPAPDDSTAKNKPLVDHHFDRRAYRLKALDSSYTILSFVVMGETQDGDIAFHTNMGETFRCATMSVWNYTKKGTRYIYCIKARHTNGLIYSLKPLSD
jgi:hypothetical protein